MGLEEYRAKRDFDRTPEPPGGAPSAAAPRFVVQQHHASHMHWDFRLELDDVLLSWAVPKGPSLDPKDKRLAVRTEDHPLDYAGFEGVIPPGEYGAGRVIVWDHGTWEPVGDAHAGLAKGDLKFRLHGRKLAGGWALVRLKPRGSERGDNWLLIKERDGDARSRDEFDVTRDAHLSVISGLSVDEIGFDDPARDPAPGAPAAPSPQDTSVPLPPRFALCTLVEGPPAGGEWLAEVKYDGYRLAVALQEGAARCFSRNGRDVTGRFAGIAQAAAGLGATEALLDGEAVVFDERGVTDFGALQHALADDPGRIAFVAFDLLRLDGHDLRTLATAQRKEVLCDLVAGLPQPPRIRFAEHVSGDGPAFFEAACAQGLEGAVFKRADAPYPVGRSRAWLKVKCRRVQEFVIGGFTPPRGARHGLGALLLGVYDESGRLDYAGRVGSGLGDRDLDALARALSSLERPDPPFFPKAPLPARMGARWVEPVLVAEVAFAEWTRDGLLRQPTFRGLRDDVDPRGVRRERPADPTDTAHGSDTQSGARIRSSPAHVLGVGITNPAKLLFPGSRVTKLDLARYYEAVAPVMMREVAGRPLTLVRCPVGGDTASCFYQRHPDRGLPRRVSTFTHELPNHTEADEWLEITSAEGLVALAQMGVAEIHTWLSRSDAPTRPDRMVLDLDPGADTTLGEVVEAARALRHAIEGLGLTPYLKSTGGRGLHVVVPIEPVWEFERVRALARALAERIATSDPGALTTKMAKKGRERRTYIDYLRNAEGASAVAPYSPRHREGAPVAVPLDWAELDDHALDVTGFTPARVLERIERGIDPWRGIGQHSAGARSLRAAEASLGTAPG